MTSFLSTISKDFSKASPNVVLDYFLCTGISATASKRAYPFKVCLLANFGLLPGFATGSKPPKAWLF